MKKKEITTPEEFVKREKKRLDNVNGMTPAAKRAEKKRKKKDDELLDIEEKLIRLKADYINLALPDSKYGHKSGGRPTKVIRNIELYQYVLESIRASIPSSQTIFNIAKIHSLSPESAKQYYWQSVKWLRSTIDNDTREELKFALTQQLEGLQRMAVTQGDLKSSIKAAELIGKIAGLFEPTKVDLSGDVSFTLSFPEIETPDNEEDTEKEDDNVK